jgi:hypothetical protein
MYRIKTKCYLSFLLSYWKDHDVLLLAVLHVPRYTQAGQCNRLKSRSIDNVIVTPLIFMIIPQPSSIASFFSNLVKKKSTLYFYK